MLDTSTKTYKNLIGGRWTDATSGETFSSINPADTSDVVGNFQASSQEDGEQAIQAAQKAFDSWRKTPPSKRASILYRAAGLLTERADQIARELTREEGKVLSASRKEVLRSASVLRYYAAEGQSLGGGTYLQDDAGAIVYTVREPLGVAVVITPWNFPISIPTRKIAPALITGNTVVFKPSSDTALTGLCLVEALVDAGLPDGALNFVTGSASHVGGVLTAHPLVRAISFTGSTGAGEAIHQAASLTTRTQLELGGKNPIIVLPDADLERAAEVTVKGGYELTGQACTGTSRVIIDRDVAEAFVDSLVAKASALTIGPGDQEGVQLTPLANKNQLERVLDYIEVGKEEGLNLVYGGERLHGGVYDKGYYVSPAVFTDVPASSRLAQEEIFGPVITVIPVDGFDEALRVANGVQYGLSASLMTRDIGAANRFVQEIEAGTVKVNRTTTGNLINAPFGGLKKSSSNSFRESGREGLEFFTQIKTVYYGS